ncbi:hypothetical protein FJZ26_01330 [Candidatus Parvarchaeota archaeon]|nr:hypothetical protein [Candidatus Parvarchaeota archaeon]
MRIVLSCPIEKKAALTALLETDPYAKDSFARAGYKVKEGSQVGLDAKLLYVHAQSSDEVCARLVEKAKEVAVPAKEEEKAKIINVIDEEDSSAQQGFGAIFG